MKFWFSKMARGRGFTLIELLVVIAIIALLLSIMAPALRTAKELASGVACRANIRSLLVAWMMYANSNDDRLVGGELDPWDEWPYQDDPSLYCWVYQPITSSHPEYQSGMSNLEREVAGIRDGLLFTYLDKTEKVYHCPADRTKPAGLSVDVAESPYRSYAIADGMCGQGYSNWCEPVEKVDEIKKPAQKYVFLEEEDAEGFNWGSWVLDPRGQSWWDPMAIRHNKKGSLGFADGHCEQRKWSAETVEYFTAYDPLASEARTPITRGGVEDLRYMQERYEAQK